MNSLFGLSARLLPIIVLNLPLLAFAHGDAGLPPGAKTIAGPGNALIEKAKPAVILEAKTPIPAACITLTNTTIFPITVLLNDAPTDYSLSNATSSYCWGKGTKKVSLRLNDLNETNPSRVLWRIDVQQ